MSEEKVTIKISNKSLIFERMKRIELLQHYIKEIDEMASYISNRKFSYDFKLDYGNIRSTLIDMELEEWRNLCMWGLTVDKSTKDRIKAAVYDRSLRDGISVAHWLNDGVTPSRWLKADEDEFRKMAKELFKPKED